MRAGSDVITRFGGRSVLRLDSSRMTRQRPFSVSRPSGCLVGPPTHLDLPFKTNQARYDSRCPSTRKGGVPSTEQSIVDGTKPARGARSERTKTPTTETTERSVSNSHSNGGGWNTFLISFHRFRYDNHVRLRHPQSGTAQPRHPEARVQGGPVEPRLASAFFSPATRPTAMTSNVRNALNAK